MQDNYVLVIGSLPDPQVYTALKTLQQQNVRAHETISRPAIPPTVILLAGRWFEWEENRNEVNRALASHIPVTQNVRFAAAICKAGPDIEAQLAKETP